MSWNPLDWIATGVTKGTKAGTEGLGSNFLWGDPKIEMDPERARLEGGERMRDFGWGSMGRVSGRQAPQAGYAQIGEVSRYDDSRSREWRQRQMALADQLRGVATGEQQGAGELAAQRMGSRAQAGQMAMARMGRGTNAALAQRAAARTGADIGGQMAGMAQQAALQDQASARAQLGGVLQAGRGGDMQIGLANMGAENQRIFQQAQLDQSTSLANMESRLRMMGMNDQAALAYMAQLFNMDLAELNARLQQDKMQIDQRGEGVVGDLLAGGASIGAAYAGKP